MEKILNKIFYIISKPSKIIFIIGCFFYALWFLISTAMGIGGNFMSVLTNVIKMIVGAALIVSIPVLLFFKRDNVAKIIFILLTGYWIVASTSKMFFLADTFADAGEFYPVFVSIFLLLAGLGLIGVLVLSLLELIIKVKFLRLITLSVAYITILVCFITAILFIVECAIMNAAWTFYVDYALMEMMVLPIVVGCGCLYFSGSAKNE